MNLCFQVGVGKRMNAPFKLCSIHRSLAACGSPQHPSSGMHVFRHQGIPSLRTDTQLVRTHSVCARMLHTHTHIGTCACVCVCMGEYARMRLCARVCMCVVACALAHMCMCVSVCMRVCAWGRGHVYPCVYVSRCVRVSMRGCMCVCAHALVYVLTHARVRAHTHTGVCFLVFLCVHMCIWGDTTVRS